jgi:hypothetical protein
MYDFIVENIKEENIDEKIKNGDHFNILKLPYDIGKGNVRTIGTETSGTLSSGNDTLLRLWGSRRGRMEILRRVRHRFAQLN